MIANKIKYFILITVAPLLLGGCLGTRHLKKDEKLLYSQAIEVPKNIDRENLRELYVQKPNRKLFGMLPINYLVGIHYAAKEKYDSLKFVQKKDSTEAKFNRKIKAVPEKNIKKINNLQFRKLKKVSTLEKKIENGNTVMQWGEPLTLFDTGAITKTKQQFSDYLFSNGYFKNKVTSDTAMYKFKILGIAFYRNKRVMKVDYILEPGKPYVIDSIYYSIHDSSVYDIIKTREKSSLIRKGDRYDQDNFSNERERIDLLLKDLGYYEFSRQYVEFDIDTTFHDNRKIAVGIIIKDPVKSDHHKVFNVTEVNFVTDAGTSSPGSERTTRDYRDIHYKYYKDDYNLRILSQRVFMIPGSLYSRTNTFNTQQQLSNLDAFKVNINYDTTGGKFVANIYTSPLDRYQWSNEAGVNVTQGFPGPFYNMTFKKRNVFRGLETLDISGRFGFEGVASATNDQNIYKSTEAGVNIAMTFPQIVFPLQERTQFKLGKYNPKTKLLTGYSFTERPEYRRTYLTLSGTYTMENKRTTQYSFTFANINIIDTVNTSSAFQEFLFDQLSLGNFGLVNSFYPSFVSSMIFGITWNHNNYGNNDRNAVFIRGTFESGGTMWNFFDPPKFITENGMQYFKYLRFNFDIRRNRVIDKNTVLAYRFNSGATYSYSANGGVPYEKFFFAGGSNGIRAWRPRRLGPGSLKPNLSSDPEKNGLFDYSIESPAEILLEGSIELRKKLFGFVNGAVFVDAGNVWSFKEWNLDADSNSGSSQFRWNEFYKEIAIGTGFGVRLDFTFLILRFDVGIKVYDPARDPDDRFVLNKLKFWKPYGTSREPVIYNVGIGYPF